MVSPGSSGWRGPIEITWRDSFDMPSIPIPCKFRGVWFVLKSIAHGSKCPIELCLHIHIGQKFTYLMKTSFVGCSKRSHPKCTCLQVNTKREICQNSRHQILRLLTDISHHEICVILLEVAFNLFTTAWFRIRSFTSARPIFGKSPCYRSCDRSANWRVKDYIMTNFNDANMRHQAATCQWNELWNGNNYYILTA